MTRTTYLDVRGIPGGGSVRGVGGRPGPGGLTRGGGPHRESEEGRLSRDNLERTTENISI